MNIKYLCKFFMNALLRFMQFTTGISKKRIHFLNLNAVHNSVSINSIIHNTHI